MHQYYHQFLVRIAIARHHDLNPGGLVGKQRCARVVSDADSFIRGFTLGDPSVQLNSQN